MNYISELIGWLGVLFLSVEAIKLDNLKKLTLILLRVRVAINPTWSRNGEKPRPDKGYEFLSRYGDLITYVVGVALIVVSLFAAHLWTDTVRFVTQYFFVFTGVPWYRPILSVLALIVVFAVIPFYLGNEFISLFSRFADRYHNLMHTLEVNTFNGIVGIIGFLLVTVSTIIKIATH